jgi:subtilisin-like proprotein convertase family protein
MRVSTHLTSSELESSTRSGEWQFKVEDLFGAQCTGRRPQ